MWVWVWVSTWVYGLAYKVEQPAAYIRSSCTYSYECAYEVWHRYPFRSYFLGKQLRVICLERLRMERVVDYVGKHSLGGAQVRVRVGEDEQFHASASLTR